MDDILDLPEIHLAGSPAAMGEAFGEACRADAQALYAIRLGDARAFAASESGRALDEATVLAAARRGLAITAGWDPAGYAELLGIARGAELSPEQAFVLNGLTDLRDLLAWGDLPAGEGCSALAVLPDRAAGPWILGQNWDLQTSNMPYIRLVHRRPTQGPPTISLTLTGCLSLIGMNAHGVAVGNTNLKTLDARDGLQYLSILHRALAADSVAAAAALIRSAPRMSGHFYYVGGPGGDYRAIDTSARLVDETCVTTGTYVHCNHALCESVRACESLAEATDANTHRRHTRLAQLLAAHPEPLGIDAVRDMLSDHHGGDDAICRHDLAGVSTNATVIMHPDRRELHACRAQPHLGHWLTRVVT